MWSQSVLFIRGSLPVCEVVSRWGSRLAANDEFLSARAVKGRSSFDPSVDATPQDLVAWRGGLYVVPDLKITFPDGNRDLVLRYLSRAVSVNILTILVKG